jgi:hypothetical protein
MIKVRALVDVQECGRVARATQGLTGNIVSLRTWKQWLKAEHSQIQIFFLSIEMSDIPSYVSVHLVRHHVGINHYVRSQRPTAMNPVGYDRRKAPQDALVNHTMILNPQSLIAISRKRLCHKADPATRRLWSYVRDVISRHQDPYVAAIASVMMPDCEYRGRCNEILPCGRAGV